MSESNFNYFEIAAYEDVDCSKAVKPQKGSTVFDSKVMMYRFPFNPSSLKVGTANNYNLSQPFGYSGINPKYIATKPRLVNVEFVIDPSAEPLYTYTEDTGIPVKETKKTLAKRMEIFEALVGYNSSSHRPNYLKLSWGTTLKMNSTLKEFHVIYGRFNDKGEPTRANIQAEFIEVVSAKKMLAAQGRQSPDISHMIEVQEGDTLPHLCENIYGDKKYYVEIAKLNGIKSLRKLTPGTQLYFPPLK
jgi:hypothetical protein